MGRKKETAENYLDRIPVRADLRWERSETGMVTLLIENRGAMNTIAQKLFHKPRFSRVHLDEMGSFLWPLLDGERTAAQLAGPLSERFGPAAEPLYPRLVKYLEILRSYRFIRFADQPPEK